MESNRIKCCLLVCHTLPLPAGNRALKSLEIKEILAWSIIFFTTIQSIQGILYSSSAEVFLFKKKTLPVNSFKNYSTEFAFTHLRPSQGMQIWRHGGLNDTLGWKEELPKARALAKIYLPWYHQCTSLITQLS